MVYKSLFFNQEIHFLCKFKNPLIHFNLLLSYVKIEGTLTKKDPGHASFRSTRISKI